MIRLYGGNVSSALSRAESNARTGTTRVGGLFRGSFADGAWARRARQSLASRILAIARKRMSYHFSRLAMEVLHLDNFDTLFAKCFGKFLSRTLSVIKRRILSKGQSLKRFSDPACWNP